MREPEKHPLFELPEDRQTKLWRFMDFTKFVALLESRTLFFCRADRLGDPFEGSISARALEARKAEAQRMGRAFQDRDSAIVMLEGFGERLWDSLEADSYMLRWSAEWMFVSCWHMNDVESAAMWNLYVPSGQGVAIQTTYERLRDQLPDDVYIGKVKYINYQRDRVDLQNGFSPFMHKRESFSHELELRAIHTKTPTHRRLNPLTGAEEQAASHHIHNREGGKPFAVDLNALIERIYVSPIAQPWYTELVKAVCSRYQVSTDIRQSDLDAQPIF
jgi:hypothetical protein